MSDGSDAFSSIVSTTELADGLVLIFIAGPDFRAPEGLALVRARLPRDRPTAWHRLDRDGPDVVSAIERSGLREPIMLVHGLENLDVAARADSEASMNMLRDRLVSARATVILWVPRSDVESFQRHCADLFAWRSLFVSLEETQVPIDPELELRRVYLARLRVRLEQTILPDRALGQVRPEILSNRMVRPLSGGQGGVLPLERWVRETKAGLLIGEAGSGKTTALMALALWWAKEAAMGEASDTPYPLLLGVRELYIGPSQGLALGAHLLPHVKDLSDAQVAAWARQGKLVLLLDAVDEVEEQARRLILDWVAKVLTQHRGLRVVMTSRSMGAASIASSWSVAKLVPLTVRQLRKQLEHMAPQQALEGRQQEVLEAVLACLELLPRQRAGISPLLVNLLYNVASTLGLMPVLPAELLDRVIGFLFEGQHGRRIGFPPLLLRRTLSMLALWGLERRARLINQEVFEAALRIAQEELGTGESSPGAAFQMFSGFADRMTWFVAEVGPGRFRFAQPLFQAFLAAEVLAAGGAEHAFQQLEPHLEQPKWRTAVVLTVALLSRRYWRSLPLFLEKLLEGCLTPELGRAARRKRVSLASDCVRAAWIVYVPIKEVQDAALRLPLRAEGAPDSADDETEREFQEAVRSALAELRRLRARP